MPGMETAAPERTETSSGLGPSPNFLPVTFSSLAMFASTSLVEPGGVLAAGL